MATEHKYKKDEEVWPLWSNSHESLKISKNNSTWENAVLQTLYGSWILRVMAWPARYQYGLLFCSILRPLCMNFDKFCQKYGDLDRIFNHKQFPWGNRYISKRNPIFGLENHGRQNRNNFLCGLYFVILFVDKKEIN